ncbi:hypothetical protein C8Q77DRAFT_1037983, partial [Trametes polyzona]
VHRIYYSDLQAILECALPPKLIWQDYEGTTLLLAYIKPCKTDRCDIMEMLMIYKEYAMPMVLDLHSMQAVVGQMKSRSKRGIVNCSSGYARTVF